MFRFLLAGLVGAALALFIERHLRQAPREISGELSVPDYDDATLAQKVMTELFRDQHVPKGAINVNVENGVALENLMHLPGESVPRS
jgi:hypothetical protein